MCDPNKTWSKSIGNENICIKIYTWNKVYDLLDYATYKDNTYYLFICRLSASQEENPLEFEDIVNKKTYDKMRPPKPDGILLFSFIL